jgi:hypothetical protein
MIDALKAFAAIWAIGTVFTWWRTTDISSDSPGIRFLLALVAWPFILIGRR